MINRYMMEDGVLDVHQQYYYVRALTILLCSLCKQESPEAKEVHICPTRTGNLCFPTHMPLPVAVALRTIVKDGIF